MYNWVLYYTVYTQVETGDGASANNSLSEEDKMRGELEDRVARVKDLEEQMAKVESDKRELQKQLTEVDGKWRQIKLQLQVNSIIIHVHTTHTILENNVWLYIYCMYHSLIMLMVSTVRTKIERFMS